MENFNPTDDKIAMLKNLTSTKGVHIANRKNVEFSRHGKIRHLVNSKLNKGRM